jgi:hypothetical protein
MSRRIVLATAAALLLGASAAPALAASAVSGAGALDPSTHCVLTHYDRNTGEREGFCVWTPVDSPFKLLPR